MKKITLFWVVLLSVISYMTVRAQIPQKIAYQAVIRNANGSVIGNEQVQIQVNFRRATANGDMVYSEIHTITTTPQGVVSLLLGDGNDASGSFAAIPWNETIFLEVLYKPSGSGSFTSMGTTQLVSVPYAFLAGRAQSAANGISSTGNPGNIAYSTGELWEPSARISIMDSTVVVSPKVGHDPEKPIFAVTNSQGQVVMAVYETGVRFYVEGSSSKGAKGGFAVGGLTGGKAQPPTYFQLEPSYAQFLFNQPAKGAKGGFAVGGLTGGKLSDTLNYMIVHPDSVRFAISSTPPKGAKGGFAVGGLSNTKATIPPYFYLDPGYAQFLFDQSAKGAKGGFAVGGLTGAKSDTNVYMSIKPDLIQFAFDTASAKGAKGGFAVGGLTNAKSSANYFFEVTPDSTYVVNTMVSYSDMILAGNVTTNVGLPQDLITDVDGNTYKTVKIGTQIWMAENLKTTKYSDGTPILSNHFYSLSNPDSVDVFGNYYLDSVLEVHSGRNVCPDGWHVPTELEWQTLFAFSGGADWALNSTVLGKKIIEPYKEVKNGVYNWDSLQIVINTTNETGFSARGASSTYWDMSYWVQPNTGNYAYFLVNSGLIQLVTIDGYSGSVTIGEGYYGEAFSIRCVKN